MHRLTSTNLHGCTLRGDLFAYFLCTASGCTNLIPPEDAWIKREDDKIVIGCYTSRQTWQLRCHDGRWTGVVSNCSHGVCIFILMTVFVAYVDTHIKFSAITAYLLVADF